MKSAVESRLSPDQGAVVAHAAESPALVDAGAGTGKTHTIIHRVEELHRSGRCAADRILLLTFARKAAAELRGRVLELLGPQIAAPRCSTFHAFAAEILTEYAYDIGLPPDSAVIEDIDARLEFRAAFEEELAKPGTDAAAFPLRPVRRDELRDGLFEIAEGLKERSIDIGSFRSRAIEAANAITALPYRIIRPHTKRAGAKLRKPIAETTDSELNDEAGQARMRVEAAAAIFRRFEQRLRLRGALTFADLLMHARHGLRANPAVIEELRRRFQHCIIDEYQDTNFAQHQFLQTLFGDGLSRVVAVGDKRQSIFGFRGARPENIHEFSALADCRTYPLSENRRSRQEILDLAHYVISPQTGDTEALRAVRGPAGRQIIHVGSRWGDDDDPNPNAERARVAQAKAAAAWIASRLLDGRKADGERFAARDVAILMRNKTQAQPFAEALVAAGIPHRLLGGTGFYETREVRDAVAWLRILADPLDGQAVARAAASAGFGVGDATLTELALGIDFDETDFVRRVLVEPLPDAIDGDARARLERLRAAVDAIEPFASAPLPLAVGSVLERTGMRLLLEQDGSPRAFQALANLRKLHAFAVGFTERFAHATAADFIHYLEELERVDYDEREADPPADDAVTIMTVHGAKGLEWPIVFLVDVWPPGKPRALVWRDERDGSLLCREDAEGRMPFHIHAALEGPDADGFIAHEDDRKTGPSDEERRLFYVALTRARDELFVFGNRADGRAHPFLSEVEGWIRSTGWVADQKPPPSPMTFPFAKAGAGTFSEIDLERLFGIREIKRAPATVSSLSYSILREFDRCPRSVSYRLNAGLPDLSVDGATVSGRGAQAPAQFDRRDVAGLLGAGEYGRLVHRSLERWTRDRIAKLPAQPAEAYVVAAGKELSVSARSQSMKRAVAAVEAALNALAGWTPLHSEAPFTVRYDGIMVTGFVDLIAFDPQGIASIVDFKTGNADPSEFALQLGLYKDAASRAYGVTDAACIIGRFAEGAFSLEMVQALTSDEVRRQVARVAAGVREGDFTAKPGEHCARCPYRAAPCMDFAK
jgi:DNA helicase-2/ATP-dependent DNA helicase PcrA